MQGNSPGKVGRDMGIPKAYNLEKRKEVERWFREMKGYINTGDITSYIKELIKQAENLPMVLMTTLRRWH